MLKCLEFLRIPDSSRKQKNLIMGMQDLADYMQIESTFVHYFEIRLF